MEITDPDVQHMLQFKEGNQNAFRKLFTRYKKNIVNFCYRFCADRELAEDLAQEVFLRVFKAAPRYRPDARFSTWIFKIATNVCLNEMRKKRYRFKRESLDIPVNTDTGEIPREIEDRVQPQPQDLLVSRERERFIREAISDLPGKQRAAILLRVVHGFSYQEIGKQIRHSEKSVKSLIYRGRQHLRQALEAKVRGE